MRAEPFNSHHATTDVHAWYNFEVDSSSREASEKKTPTFFSRTHDRYKEGSEVVNAGVWKWSIFERESFNNG